MPTFDHDTLAKLMMQIASDLEAAAKMAAAASGAASNNAEAGRINDAFQNVLEAEPHIHHARSLVGVASYVAELSGCRGSNE